MATTGLDFPPNGSTTGLLALPRNEVETTLIAALLFDRLGLCLWRANNQYPDWVVLYHSRSGWRRLNVEVEFRSSGFRSHLNDHRRVPTGSHFILCWEDDRNPTGAPGYPHPILAIALRDVIASIPVHERSQLCWASRHLSSNEEGLRRARAALDSVADRCEPVDGIPATFAGLCHLPTNEYELVLAAGIHFAKFEPSVVIESISERFPDFHLRIWNERTWEACGAEAEYLSSKYHHETTSDGLVCWRDDRKKSGFRHMWELERLYSAMSREQRIHMCLGRKTPEFTGCSSLPDLLRQLEFMPNDAKNVFAAIIKGLVELGFPPQTGTPGSVRQGASFRLGQPGGTETINLFPGYSGRYIFPTVWISLESIRKLARERDQSTVELERIFRDLDDVSLKTSGKGRHVVYGISCLPGVFGKCVDPILRLGHYVRPLHR